MEELKDLYWLLNIQADKMEDIEKDIDNEIENLDSLDDFELEIFNECREITESINADLWRLRDLAGKIDAYLSENDLSLK